MAHAKRVLVVLLVALTLVLSAVPASADPGTSNQNSVHHPRPANVSWE